LLVPVTAAVNCCVCDAVIDAVVGVNEIDTGLSVTIAVADLVVSATLVALTVTIVCAVTVEGAVYSPAPEIDPAPTGLIAQVTAVLLDPVTAAVNCKVWDTVRVAVSGVTVTATAGFNVTIATAILVVSATLVAVIVTIVWVATVAGELYNPPLVIVPAPLGLTVHVTAVLLEPVTLALNCNDCEATSVPVVGETETATGGFKVTIAAADFVVSATLVAVTVTTVWAATVAGAV
jgi:hypothetical protein